MSTKTSKFKLISKLIPIFPSIVAAVAVIFLNSFLPWMLLLGAIFVAYIYLKRTFGPELAMETATTALATLAFLKLSSFIIPLLFIAFIVGVVYMVSKNLLASN